MKALAALSRHIDDLRHLARLANIRTVDDALRVCRDFFAEDEISARTRAELEELFE